MTRFQIVDRLIQNVALHPYSLALCLILYLSSDVWGGALHVKSTWEHSSPVKHACKYAARDTWATLQARQSVSASASQKQASEKWLTQMTVG